MLHTVIRFLGGSWGCVHNTLFSLLLINEPNKLECYVSLGRKGLSRNKHSSFLSLLDPFISNKENEAL